MKKKKKKNEENHTSSVMTLAQWTIIVLCVLFIWYWRDVLKRQTKHIVKNERTLRMRKKSITTHIIHKFIWCVSWKTHNRIQPISRASAWGRNLSRLVHFRFDICISTHRIYVFCSCLQNANGVNMKTWVCECVTVCGCCCLYFSWCVHQKKKKRLLSLTRFLVVTECQQRKHKTVHIFTISHRTHTYV